MTKKSRTWFAMIALFLAGALVGAAGMGLYGRKAVEHILHGERPAVAKLVLEKLTKELNLDDKQQAYVRGVVLEAEGEILELRKRHRPEVEAVISKAVEKMKVELTPAQQQKLDALHEKARSHWNRRWFREGGRDHSGS